MGWKGNLSEWNNMKTLTWIVSGFEFKTPSSNSTYDNMVD